MITEYRALTATSKILYNREVILPRQAGLPRKGYPAQLGPVALRLDPQQVVLCDRKDTALLTLPDPRYVDTGAGGPYSRSTRTITGTRLGDYVGGPATITTAYTGPDRTATLTINLAYPVLTVTLEVTYSADKDAVYEGVDVGIGVSGYTFLADGDALCPIGGGTIQVATDYSAYNPNFYYDAAAAQVDMSWQHRPTGTTREAHLTVLLSSAAVPVYPLYQPDGRLASVMFAEHADAVTTESVAACFYGASDPSHPDYGSKGFIGRGLKTTWSVFYTTRPGNIGLDDAGFASLMDAIYATGTEVVPHRTANYIDHRADALTALPFYNTHYGTRNWIDHGLTGGIECIGHHSKGWDPSDATNYIMDLMDTYGYEYTWAYQDLPVAQANGLDQVKVPGAWAGHPWYLIYQATTLSKASGIPIWQWWSYRPPNRYLMDYFNPTTIDRLLSTFGVTIIHDYFATGSYDGYTYESGTPYLITTGFDTVLAYTGSKVTAGDLWNPTVSEWGDYYRKVVQVRLESQGSRTYKLTNNSGSTILGYTMRAPTLSCTPLLDSVAMSTRTKGTNTVFWADLPTGEHTLTL